MKVLAKYGPAGKRVRVVQRDDLVTVEWYVDRVRQQKSWPNTRDNTGLAKEWARVFAEERSGSVRPEPLQLTIREVWDRYREANYSHLRPGTQQLYRDEWRRWELFAGRSFIAQEITSDMIHGYRRAMEKQGLGVNSIKNAVRTCKLVYRWAESEELITRNRWGLYRLKIAKDAKPKSPEEYTGDEATALMKQLDPTSATQWRPWVTIHILGHQGVRQVAALQLEWSHLDLARRGINWPPETDKVGVGMFQPLRKATVRALRVAREWAKKQGIESRYVLPAGSSKNRNGHYTIQSFWRALKEAEKRAGVARLPYRAGHGFRKLVAGDVFELTGNALVALRSIGDRDPRRAEEYLKERDGVLRQAFRGADATRKSHGSRTWKETTSRAIQEN